jgi:hypothetical protein
MIEHNFDPWTMLEQMQVNQKQLDINVQNVVRATNNNTNVIQDHDRRLDLNQQTINQILASLQNQQKLLLSLFDEFGKLHAVNNEQGQQK